MLYESLIARYAVNNRLDLSDLRNRDESAYRYYVLNKKAVSQYLASKGIRIVLIPKRYRYTQSLKIRLEQALKMQGGQKLNLSKLREDQLSLYILLSGHAKKQNLGIHEYLDKIHIPYTTTREEKKMERIKSILKKYSNNDGEIEIDAKSADYVFLCRSKGDMSVKEFIESYGYKYGETKPTNETRYFQMVLLIKQGLTDGEIGEKLGISRQGVSDYVKRHKLR